MTDDLRTSIPDRLRQLPSVSEMLSLPEVGRLIGPHLRTQVVEAARRVIERQRELIRAGGTPDLSPEALAREVEREAISRARLGQRRVVNATGVIIHTGLGRSVLPARALAAVQRELAGYSSLAVDLESGERAARERHVAELFCRLTGAEASTVVNNNAAATMLVLTVLAQGREVIVSRGQLVEIGGSFRIPDVMEQSGARLVEVGTTNKTRLSDYEQAITDQTALLLRVHPSNYRLVGFTDAVPLTDLVALGRKHGLPVMDDIGSGLLVDLGAYGLHDEPVAGDSIKAGADVVTFSCDKLVGGPQGGGIIGKAEPLQRIRKHPLARALRCGKLSLVALESTLRLFLDRDSLPETNPTFAMLGEDARRIRRRARALAARLRKAVPDADISVEPDESQVGSGSLPAQPIPTYVVSVGLRGLSPEALARHLRLHQPPILARLHADRVLFDLRTVLKGEERLIADALAGPLAG
ncbi:MAG: L-seryl-tRNA(Sec) selenium transferase [Armatimonadota bacterium]